MPEIQIDRILLSGAIRGRLCETSPHHPAVLCFNVIAADNNHTKRATGRNGFNQVRPFKAQEIGGELLFHWCCWQQPTST